jgi:hypothetical protein
VSDINKHSFASLKMGIQIGSIFILQWHNPLRFLSIAHLQCLRIIVTFRGLLLERRAGIFALLVLMNEVITWRPTQECVQHTLNNNKNAPRLTSRLEFSYTIIIISCIEI